MKFNPENPDELEHPQNTSIVSVENIYEKVGNLPGFTPEYFHIIKQPSLQFMVSQLASLIIPIAPIYIEESESGRKRFYSRNVKSHADFIQNDSRELVYKKDEDEFIIKYLFEDFDHNAIVNHNYERGCIL